MNLVVISHKECWADRASPSGYSTIGGFPQQMNALSGLFDNTRVVQALFPAPMPQGALPITGHNLTVQAIPAPKGKNLFRKIGLLFWLPRRLPVIISEISRADVIHTPIPGDIGTLGMVLGLVMKKRLFVRHCGNWYVQQTKAEKFWKWFMERFGSSENLMLATGGADEPPSKTNPHIRWIFSTTLTEKEICALREKRKELKPSKRLVIVCRQEKAKGTETVIRALQLIAAKYPDVQLDVVGDGSALGYFKSLAKELEIDSRLLFHGNVCHEKVIQILCQASIFCFPTKSSEGFPKAVLEALAAGVPVIATRVSVLPYLLRNGCGLLMDDGTPQELAEFASNLLSDDRRWLRMSETALATAKEYTLERWKESIRDALFGSRQACHTAGIFS